MPIVDNMNLYATGYQSYYNY